MKQYIYFRFLADFALHVTLAMDTMVRTAMPKDTVHVDSPSNSHNTTRRVGMIKKRSRYTIMLNDSAQNRAIWTSAHTAATLHDTDVRFRVN